MQMYVLVCTQSGVLSVSMTLPCSVVLPANQPWHLLPACLMSSVLPRTFTSQGYALSSFYHPLLVLWIPSAVNRKESELVIPWDERWFICFEAIRQLEGKGAGMNVKRLRGYACPALLFSASSVWRNQKGISREGKGTYPVIMIPTPPWTLVPKESVQETKRQGANLSIHPKQYSTGKEEDVWTADPGRRDIQNLALQPRLGLPNVTKEELRGCGAWSKLNGSVLIFWNEEYKERISS